MKRNATQCHTEYSTGHNVPLSIVISPNGSNSRIKKCRKKVILDMQEADMLEKPIFLVLCGLLCINRTLWKRLRHRHLSDKIFLAIFLIPLIYPDSKSI